jgi:group I intron endonuclease
MISNNFNNKISPIIIYKNVKTDKKNILSDLKNKAGIYMFSHNDSGKVYIGSAYNLSKRFQYYYSPTELKRIDNLIARALLLYSLDAFSLSILEEIDISDLNKKEAREKILSREQFYLDLIFSENDLEVYNILKLAGSSLGYTHLEETKLLIGKANKGRVPSEETITKMSEAHKGKTHSDITLAKLSEAKKGNNHPLFGKLHSAGTKALMRKAKLGKIPPLFEKTGENHPASKRIFVSKIDLKTKELALFKTFNSCSEATKYFNCSNATITKYTKNGKLYKDQWSFSLSLTTKGE